MLFTYIYTIAKILWNFIKSFLALMVYLLTILYIYSLILLSKTILTSINFKMSIPFPNSDSITKPSNFMSQRINESFISFFRTITLCNVKIYVPRFVVERFWLLLVIVGIAFLIYIVTSFIPFVKHFKLRSTGARPITDREYLDIKDAFNEICSKISNKNNDASKIKLYVYDSRIINCHVFSNNIICVNKGVLSLDSYMMKAMLMHELAHIKLNHALNIHLIMMSSYFLEYTLFPFNYLSTSTRSIAFRTTFTFIGWICKIIFYIPEKIFEVIQFYILKIYECQADDLTIKYGYIKGLYHVLEKLEPTQKPVTIIESLYLSHPHLSYRLDRVHKELSKNHIIIKR